MTAQITVGTKSIGDNLPLFIIAEAANNHNGDFELAKRMVEAAAAFGADAVKFQCLFVNDFAVKTHPYYDSVYKKITFDETQWQTLIELAHTSNILFAVDVLDQHAVALMGRLRADIIKVHCGDIRNYDLLRQAAAIHIPILLHTGYATFSEITAAVETLRDAGNAQILPLYGFQDYPTEMRHLNLRAFKKLKDAFSLPVGFMDHTDDIIAPILSLGFGINVLEKHFTLDRNKKGFDWQSSIEPDSFGKMIRQIRVCEEAFGTGDIIQTAEERKHLPLVRKFIVATRTINKGETITRDALTAKRSEPGLEADQYGLVVGKKALCSIGLDEIVTQEKVQQ